MMASACAAWQRHKNRNAKMGSKRKRYRYWIEYKLIAHELERGIPNPLRRPVCCAKKNFMRVWGAWGAQAISVHLFSFGKTTRRNCAYHLLLEHLCIQRED
ncbi:hypothetical protein TRVL_08008 [Trypanosoma vivax]|nr:hypothetical protein TRVL_08008 [Trypanosoma vivax]